MGPMSYVQNTTKVWKQWHNWLNISSEEISTKVGWYFRSKNENWYVSICLVGVHRGKVSRHFEWLYIIHVILKLDVVVSRLLWEGLESQ